MDAAPLRCLLVANRGEIARRVLRTARRLGLRGVAIFSPADRGMSWLAEADLAVEVNSYIDADAILDAARRAGADAIHPGYGFLSERPAFAAAVQAAGLIWVGPPVTAMQAMSSKADARRAMAARGVPVLPGYDGEDQGQDALLAAARGLGLPLMVKASAGGGGKGMAVVRSWDDLPDAIASAKRLAASAFGDDRLVLERFVDRPRHVEVQVIGDQQGALLHLWERECSLQRRHQKVIEEAPAPAFVGRPAARAALLADAVEAAAAVGYHSAGTVEFIVDEAGQHYFLEMNTRLQVEHAVTEAITGLDLVELQLRVAAGEALPLAQAELPSRGWSIEARVYAEDPSRGYLPSTGPLLRFHLPAPEGGRVDVALAEGEAVVPDYDPMLAKVVAWGADREQARARLAGALRRARVAGVATNLPQLIEALDAEPVRRGALHTGLLDEEQLVGLRSRPAVRRDGLIAGCVAILDEEAGSGPLGRSVPVGFRNNPWPEPPLRLVVDGQEQRIAAQWDGQRGRLGGPRTLPAAGALAGPAPEALPEAVEVELLGRQGGALRVRVTEGGASRLISAEVVAKGDVMHVMLDGGTVPLLRRPVADPPARAGEAGGASAPMPGRVVRLLVEDGAQVGVGEGLMVLEAMKMEQVVRAAEAGTVRLLVAAGQSVSAGQRLARISAEG
jgi:acetyl/propionyl-CoA carboxylase alpha subunit